MLSDDCDLGQLVLQGKGSRDDDVIAVGARKQLHHWYALVHGVMISLRPACVILSAWQRSSERIGPAHPRLLAKAGVSTKQICGRSRQAVCELWSHQFGWELRLVIDGGELTRSQVVRSNDEILDTQEEWKAAMVGKVGASPELDTISASTG